MCAFWLKMIGTSDNHWNESKVYTAKYVGFRHRRPSGIHRGDRMVLYAVGGSKRIFALCDVTSEWYESKEGKDEGWPYRVDIELEISLAAAMAVDACEIFPSPGVLRGKVGQHSHVKLTPEEYEKAAALLRAKSKE